MQLKSTFLWGKSLQSVGYREPMLRLRSSSVTSVGNAARQGRSGGAASAGLSSTALLSARRLTGTFARHSHSVPECFYAQLQVMRTICVLSLARFECCTATQ